MTTRRLVTTPKLRYILPVCIVAASITPAALAQMAPTSTTPNALPGAVVESNKDLFTEQPVSGETIPGAGIPQPGEDDDSLIEQQPGTYSQDPAPPQTIDVKRIEVDDVNLLPDALIRETVAPYENRTLTFDALRELTQKLTKLYEANGYVTTLVYIPEQTIENGVVHLKAAEGLVSEVSLESTRWVKPRAIIPRIDLEPGEPFKITDLRRSLRRINQTPDLAVQAVLKAGENPGETNITLVPLNDKPPIHLSGFYDNLGRDLIGTQRLGVTLADNNLTTLGDQAFGSVNWTRRSVGVASHYELPVGPHGTSVQFDYAHSRLKLGDEFEPLDIRGRATVYSPQISQEFLRNDHWVIGSDLGFDFKNLQTTLLGEELFRDQVRLLRPVLNIEEYDKTGRTLLRHEFGIGLDVFGATNGNEATASRAGAGSKFFRYTAVAVRNQRLPWGMATVFKGIGQVSPDRLVSTEQLQIGGAATVRGYREGRLIGDAGYVLSAELQVPFFFLPKTWHIPKTSYGLRDNLRFVTFVDFGASFTNKPAAGVDPNEYVLGVGVGVRARLTRFLVGRVDVGIPLLRQAPDSQVPRLHFGLESAIF